MCGVVNLAHSIRICVTLALHFSLRIINFCHFRFVTLIGLCLVNPSFHSGKFVIPCHLSSKKDHLIKHLYSSLTVWDRDVSFSPCRSVSTSQQIAIISVPSELVINLVLLVHINLIHQGLCKTWNTQAPQKIMKIVKNNNYTIIEN